MVVAACGKEPVVAPRVIAGVPNDVFSQADRVYVRPTGGDARADQIATNQIDLVRAGTDTKVIDDVDVHAWPEHAIVYGGPAINRALSEPLPLTIGDGRLQLGGETFVGDDLRLVTLVPAQPGRPAFVLYAATTAGGLAEINSLAHGGDPILIADAFGTLVTGRWVARGDRVDAELGPRARRIGWRTVTRTVGKMSVRVRFPDMLAIAADDEATIAACVAGVTQAVTKLAIDPSAPLDIYVYPDRRSELSLTNDQGDGHAVSAAHALHVLKNPPAAMTSLVAHEATHILAVDAFGLAGMALMGEGLAVWVAGQYGGTALADWRLDVVPPLGALVGRAFRKLPEGVAYPYAGTFIAVAIERLGLTRVEHALLPLSPFGWDEAWAALAVEPAALAAEVQRRLTK